MQPLYFKLSERNETASVPRWQYFMHMPIFNVEYAKAAHHDSMTAVNNIVREHMATKTAAMWVERLQAWDEFWTKVRA